MHAKTHANFVFNCTLASSLFILFIIFKPQFQLPSVKTRIKLILTTKAVGTQREPWWSAAFINNIVPRFAETTLIHAGTIPLASPLTQRLELVSYLQAGVQSQEHATLMMMWARTEATSGSLYRDGPESMETKRERRRGQGDESTGGSSDFRRSWSSSSVAESDTSFPFHFFSSSLSSPVSQSGCAAWAHCCRLGNFSACFFSFQRIRAESFF
jgi:hypothetical protein